MSKLFISHSSKDDTFVRELRMALADHDQEGWIDSRELRGGDPLWPEIEKALEEASAYAIVVSTDSLQSKWVGRELKHALKIREERGKDKYPVIPLSLNDTKLGVLEEFFGEEPIYIPVNSGPGGIEAAMNAILVALGKRDPADIPPIPQPKHEPLEELVLELTDLKFHEQDGIRRASARARLMYQPATPGQPEVKSTQSWRLIAPIGPIEAGELTWYLEQYAVWPSGIPVIRDRAKRVEENLVTWGRGIYAAAMPVAHTANVLQAWAKITSHADRRFSVYVDSSLEAGTSEADTKTAQEAATEQLRLPWELLHDGEAFLFQGAKPVRVRRRLPNTKVLDVPVVAPPIRILLITARPEDEACGYLDHRASALPLVEAMEALPGLVKLHVLNPPTLPALRTELERARSAGEPYHVVHFDGHGVYSRQVGLGGLCFEHPDDIGKLDERRHITVFTQDSTEHGTGLGSLLREHRIPIVFLEACQTAQAEKASESVASELLRVGVASVVAMTHSVLLETASRFVEAFYQKLAEGQRVGDAMLEGQRRLKDDTSRGRVFGEDELRLEDWFVPVLYQEKDDPQLFQAIPSLQTLEDARTRLARRMGELPPTPETGFVGRSRELLALQRILHTERFAVVRGQGGEGKTVLAAEFARWMVRSQQVRRAAFVSVELYGNVRAVVDALGHQLVSPDFSAAGDLEEAIKRVERALREQQALLVIDNMESILLPPFMAEETPDALSDDAREELTAILNLCERLIKVGDTRVVFTSREALPAPFDAQRDRRELYRLSREDAVKLVERVLNAAGGDAGASAETREEIEALVESVNGHARTLALLAPSLQGRGAKATRESLVELMAEMERKFPGSREKSVFASVELSLQRMTTENRERVRVLSLFHGGFKLEVLGLMMHWDEADLVSLARELIGTGLATPNPYNHLTLNPALCPYLRAQLAAAEREALTTRWVETMREYAEFLQQQENRNAELAATLTVLELPNLFSLLDIVQRAGDAETTIDLVTSLYSLLQVLGKPRLLERVGQVRDTAAAALGNAWNHARFEAARTQIEQQLARGQLREALYDSQTLLQRAQAAGEQAYSGADYDLAMACILLARVLKTAGGSEQSLPLLDQARKRFETIAMERESKAAEGMASVCLSERGYCLWLLGRLDEAAVAYEESIRRSEQLGDKRDVAVGKAQMGSIRINQRRYPEALAALAEARERFTQLDEPGTVAIVWHQTGLAYQHSGQPKAAEDAYRKSLAIQVRLGNVAGRAGTLGQLGNLYQEVLGRPEEAIAFYRQAADKYVEIGDAANEGRARNNLAETLRTLRRMDEARLEIRRAIECNEQFGHASGPWTSWSVLSDIETDAGNSAAASEAKRKAIASYLAYRRDGGENHTVPGRLFYAVTQALRAGQKAQAGKIIAEYRERWKDDKNPEADALEAILAGSRDPTLADSSELNYQMAAEILILIETLEKQK